MLIQTNKSNQARCGRRLGEAPGWRVAARGCKAWIMLMLLFGMLPLTATSVASDSVIAIDQLSMQWLRAPARYWVTSEARDVTDLPLDRFVPLESSDVNRGITSDHHWIHVRLSNASGSEPVRWVIHHETAYLDGLSAYLTNHDGSYTEHHISDRTPFPERSLHYRRLGVEHETPAGGHTDVLLRLKFSSADTMALNLNLARSDLFHAQSRHDYFGHGLFFGVLGSLILITLALSVSLRQRIFVAYGTFLALSLLMWAQLQGFGFQLLWPRAVYLQNEGIHLVYLLSAISALWFSRLFLKTRQQMPRVDRVIQALMLLFAAGILLRLLGFYEPVLYLSYFALASLSGLSVLGWLAFRQGLGYARWYSVAWAVFGAGLLLSVLSAGSSWFNWGMKPLVFAQAGSLLEAGLLMLALNERLTEWRHDHQRVLRLANQDPLTGLGNRRALSRAFAQWSQIGCVAPGPVFLIMIDLDHFKRINDSYGHEAGDLVLVEFSALLRRLCRPDDICVRYGGEEFAVLLRAPGLAEAKEVAERIRNEFSANPTVYNGVAINHTLTIGLSELNVAEAEWQLDELFRQADSALYSAKDAGRNKTVVYD